MRAVLWMGLIASLGCKTTTEESVVHDGITPHWGELNCRVTRSGQLLGKIKPEIISGSELASGNTVLVAGRKFSVVLETGSEFDTQSSLTMTLDDQVLEVFDPGQAIYKLSKDDRQLELQCYYKSGRSLPAQIRSAKMSCKADQGGQKVTPIKHQTMAGNQEPEPSVYLYENHTIAVNFFEGNQQRLTVELDGAMAEVVSPKNSLYKLSTGDGTQVQCVAE